jgi:uncharacterized protein YuzE
MKVKYDAEVDALVITLRKAAVAHTEEIDEGMLADYDCDEQVISIEILDASTRVTHPDRVEFEVRNSSPVEEPVLVGSGAR